MIFGINTTSDNSKLLHLINLRQFWNITSRIYTKYHFQITLLFVYTTTHTRFVIFTCRYFKLSWITTAISQSNCRNFSYSSIIHVIYQWLVHQSPHTFLKRSWGAASAPVSVWVKKVLQSSRVLLMPKMIKQNNKLFTVKWISKGISQIILSNLGQNCVLQINDIKMIESRQDTEIIKCDRKCGRTNPLQLKHVNIGGFSNNYPGVQPPLRSKPTLVLNLLIKSLVPKTGQNEFSPNNSNTVLHYQEKKLRELTKWSPMRKSFDLLSNSHKQFLKKCIQVMQSREFLCWYWDLKG